MRSTNVRASLLWTFLPTPLVLDLIETIRPALSVYDCADDLPETSARTRKILPSETRLFREADLVFVTAERLRARAAASRSQVDVFPFGVARYPTTSRPSTSRSSRNRLANVTAAIYPAELNEYRAMGLPVGSTPIAELVRFDASHHHVMSLAGDPGALASAIGAALSSRASETAARRIAVARGNAWDPRIDRMVALVEEALAARARPNAVV